MDFRVIDRLVDRDGQGYGHGWGGADQGEKRWRGIKVGGPEWVAGPEAVGLKRYRRA